MEKKKSLNQSETTMGKFYVLLIWGVTSLIACLLVAWVNLDIHTMGRKEQIISRIERVKKFRDVQNEEISDIASLYNKINRFNPGIYAQYEETEIKMIANDLKSIYEGNAQDKRYEMFSHSAEMYAMWLTDKKKLWTKKQNIENFSQKLQDCEIGLQRVQDKLKIEK